jgi:hypothetical protein
MAKDKKKKKSKSAVDLTIYIVLKHGLKGGKIIQTQHKWVAIDGKAHRRGNRVVWQIMDPGQHDLDIDPPDVIDSDSLRINGNRATADIFSGAEPGYYEYLITVDGEDVEGGSAPGIIIE